jgi:hypothetical protein
MAAMSEVTQLLNSIGQGEPQPAERLLSLVYAELRRLAAQKLAHVMAVLVKTRLPDVFAVFLN